MPRKQKRTPIFIIEIVRALERQAMNTDTDPRWIAASELRRLDGWESRTLTLDPPRKKKVK